MFVCVVAGGAASAGGSIGISVSGGGSSGSSTGSSSRIITTGSRIISGGKKLIKIIRKKPGDAGNVTDDLGAQDVSYENVISGGLLGKMCIKNNTIYS